MVSSIEAFGQCNPGPPIGGRLNRCYDDGYVYVDSTGNAGGYTAYWGYQESAQIVDHFLLLHSRTYVNTYTIQVLTDTYDLEALFPPLAPYSGTFQGPGPVILDAPLSRSTNAIILPALSIHHTASNGVVIAWPSSGAWTLQQNTNLISNDWTDVPTAPNDDGTNTWVTVSRAIDSRFYRLTRPL